MTRRDLLRMVSGSLLSIPFITRVQVWYGTLGQWLYHSEHGVRRLEKMKMLVEVPGSAFSSIPSTFVKYSNSPGFVRHTGWVGHYETTHHRILGWMDRAGRVWWAKKPN